MTAPGEDPRNRPGRIVAATLLVALVAAASLRLVDAGAGLATDSGRGMRRHASIEEAEGILGARLFVPAYHPEELGWPPASIRTTRQPRAAALDFLGRGSSPWQLRFVQVVDEGTPVPRRLLPPAEPFHRLGVDLDGTPAELARIDLAGEGTWDELSFTRGGRRMVLRFRGPTPTLLAIGRSLAGGER